VYVFKFNDLFASTSTYFSHSLVDDSVLNLAGKREKLGSVLCFDVSFTSTPSVSYSWLHNEPASGVYIASQRRFFHRSVLKSSVALDENSFMSAFGIYF
jgi:hypothetical protein